MWVLYSTLDTGIYICNYVKRLDRYIRSIHHSPICIIYVLPSDISHIMYVELDDLRKMLIGKFIFVIDPTYFTSSVLRHVMCWRIGEIEEMPDHYGYWIYDEYGKTHIKLSAGTMKRMLQGDIVKDEWYICFLPDFARDLVRDITEWQNCSLTPKYPVAEDDPC